MDNRYYQSLHDIADAIERIDKFVGTPRIFEQFDKDILVRQAVERNFEIIGEAVNRLKETTPEIAISDARKIINLRNKISHGYDEVENVQIWSIIINHLPTLKREIQTLLSEKPLSEEPKAD
jgi:uncharacterized protein with HEPN domain